MLPSLFLAMPLAGWQETRDTIHLYSKVLGKIRTALTPPQRHWWHISLRVGASGLTTGAIPISDADDESTFEMLLDFERHQLVVTTSQRDRQELALTGQSARAFCEATLAILAKSGIQPDIDRRPFSDTTPGTYDLADVEIFWSALARVDRIFKEFKAKLPGETSPVQLWPHHFDLSLVWFSGRKVPGVDPSDEESADEQISFGFSTGDEGIPNPYFYSSPYPWPERITNVPLPEKVSWHTLGWKGALMMYETLVKAEEPEAKLKEYLRAAYEAGASFMKEEE